jgi:thiamine transport system permease protein
LLALVETVIALLIVFFYSGLEKHGISTEGQSLFSRKKKPLTLRSNILFQVFFLHVMIFFVAPIFSIPIKAFFVPSTFVKLFSHKTFFPAVLASVTSASMTALLSTGGAFLYALFLRIKDPAKQNRVLRFLPYVPMAISSVVLGFVISYVISYFARITNLFTLSLCQAFLFWPFAFRHLQNVFDKIPYELDEVAMIFAPSLLYSVIKGYFPLIKKALVSAFCLSFAMSLGDASLPLILAIPNVQTLALLTYRLAGSYRFAEACATGTVILALSMFLFSFSDD